MPYMEDYESCILHSYCRDIDIFLSFVNRTGLAPQG